MHEEKLDQKRGMSWFFVFMIPTLLFFYLYAPASEHKAASRHQIALKKKCNSNVSQGLASDTRKLVGAELHHLTKMLAENWLTIPNGSRWKMLRLLIDAYVSMGKGKSVEDQSYRYSNEGQQCWESAIGKHESKEFQEAIDSYEMAVINFGIAILRSSSAVFHYNDAEDCCIKANELLLVNH